MGPSHGGLPLYKGSGGLGSFSSDKYRRGGILALAERYIRAIINDPKTKNVFFFLLLNIAFTAVEFIWGWWTNSLGLISDAVHMLFDSSALIFSLIASVIVKWEATDSFTYGFGRVETLTGFANALALVFASIGIIWEALERLYDPPSIKMDNLLTVSVLGFLVNIVGIFAFDHGGMGHHHGHGGHDHSHGFSLFGGHSHGHGSHNTSGHSHGGHDPLIQMDSVAYGMDHKHHSDHGHGSHDHGGHDHKGHGGHDDHGHGGHGHSHGDSGHGGHSHDVGASNGHAHGGHSHGSSSNSTGGLAQNLLLHSMFLHVLADTLGSVGVIISSILINLYGWTWADPFASLFIASLILLSIWPLLVESSCTLLQRIPQTILGRTAEAYRRLQLIDGVVSFSQPHFWELCQGKNFGSIKVQVREGTNLDRARIQIVGLFREYDIQDMVVQLEQDVVVGY
ncbi:hypothetical protein HDU96_001387 [Phlyctochytrium bullatum]|nr:hypothetical protein HDU96_001387 [Phlyctochytrium bullatum]